ncbi:hypothetical protein JKP88DRAFT_279234 [Tribonema minus]|uniref:Uncharacterized protein n=1 Tax=Tribonema minus TaxID=303371 RepID=A0A836CCK1_9STRA|nr:hypothetical protein JKP88DRAFT_279234 [Tribonema minus]
MGCQVSSYAAVDEPDSPPGDKAGVLTPTTISVSSAVGTASPTRSCRSESIDYAPVDTVGHSEAGLIVTGARHDSDKALRTASLKRQRPEHQSSLKAEHLPQASAPSFNGKQLQQLAQAFNEYSTLDSQDLPRLALDRVPKALEQVPIVGFRSLPAPLAERVFSSIVEGDGDGCYTLKDYLRAANKLSSTKRPFWLDLTYKVYNGDGGVSRAHMAEVVRLVSRAIHAQLNAFAAAVSGERLGDKALARVADACADSFVESAFKEAKDPAQMSRKEFTAWVQTKPQIVCCLWEFSLSAPLALGPFCKSTS